TPQLQQAIKLLQMSNVELTEFIEQEIEQNPLLEREEAEGGLEGDAPEAPAADEASDDSAGDADAGADFDGDTDVLPPDDPAYDDMETLPDSADHAASESMGEEDRSLDTDFENVYEPESASDGATAAAGGDEGDGLNWSTAGGGGGGFDDDLSGLENVAAEETTLRDHLLGQVNIDFDDPIDIMIADRLIDMLDDNGWLSGELETVAVALGCTIERVEATLARCQQLDPPGIFGRSLAECLALQLREKGRFDPAMEALLDNLELLGKREFTQLRRICGVDNEDLLQMVTEIKELNPRPASDFNHEVAQPVVPDVFVRRTKEGWAVELNSDTMPRVLVNNRYYATVRRHARSKEDKEFLSDRFQSANWLVRALHQRAETILKVASELVTQQEAFFEDGVEFLKPLTLRDVAEEVSVHESTVSRVTANKYLGMSRGIFEMKYFFNSAIGQNEAGESRSAEAIRFRIKSLIDREAPESVLSDDRIVDILREEGIDIARRTVAKYRDAMHIPSSVQRRREKALHA
ncbi:MAG: RNA polymerase factor sigma-54, partial [Alphaproteobacteria bacterium]